MIEFRSRKLAVLGGVLLIGVAVSGCIRPTAAPVPEVSVEVPGGSGSFSGGENAKLPAEWPADIPAPAGLKLEGTANISGRDEVQRSMTATYAGSGSLSTISEQLSADFKKAGYTSEAAYDSTTGGATQWEKGSVKVTVITSAMDGKVTVSETVLLPKAS